MQTIIVICVTLASVVLSQQTFDDYIQTIMKANFQTRCTLRYTPGVCAQPVTVVWTFVFQIQNCSERLGCPTSTRTNRFPTYRQCMRRCRGIADLYSQVLAMGGRNDTDEALRRPAGAALRQKPTTEFPITGEFFEDSDSEYHSDNFGDLPLGNPPYKQRGPGSELQDIIPPDIDYVQSDHVPNPYDPFHDAFGTN